MRYWESGSGIAEIALRDDLFEVKGELKVQSLRIGETTWTPDGKR